MVVDKEFKFSSSHRLFNYNGKCRNLHGHNYRMKVYFESFTPNEDGMVEDFGKIKNVVGDWIDQLWDHNTLIHPEDLSLINFLEKEKNNFFIMPNEYPNPTAENMVKVIFEEFSKELKGVNLVEVKIWETDSACASSKRGESFE